MVHLLLHRLMRCQAHYTATSSIAAHHAIFTQDIRAPILSVCSMGLVLGRRAQACSFVPSLSSVACASGVASLAVGGLIVMGSSTLVGICFPPACAGSEGMAWRAAAGVAPLRHLVPKRHPGLGSLPPVPCPYCVFSLNPKP